MQKAAGKWNTYEITAQGPHRSSCSTVKRPLTCRTASICAGHVALQYGSGVVKFRKVQIKPL